MKISVVIPTYNYAEFLPKAIDSILAQTVQPCEIIVADDGSTDKTEEVVIRYGDAVRYIRFDHQGVYAIRSAVLKMVQGDWFFNLDADNWVEPDFFERAIARYHSDGNADGKLAFIYPDIVTFGDYVRQQPVPEFDLNRFKTGNFVDMNSLVRVFAARKVDFDPDFNSGWGDYDFFLSLSECGYRGVTLKGCPLHYRVHCKSITSQTNVLSRKKHLIEKICKKHNSFFTETEQWRAIRRFSPNAVLRFRLSELMWAKRYGHAVGYAFYLLFRHPCAYLSLLANEKVAYTLHRIRRGTCLRHNEKLTVKNE